MQRIVIAGLLASTLLSGTFSTAEAQQKHYLNLGADPENPGLQPKAGQHLVAVDKDVCSSGWGTGSGRRVKGCYPRGTVLIVDDATNEVVAVFYCGNTPGEKLRVTGKLVTLGPVASPVGVTRAPRDGNDGKSVTVSRVNAGDVNCFFGGAKFTDGSGNVAYACNGANGNDGQDGADAGVDLFPCNNSPAWAVGCIGAAIAGGILIAKSRNGSDDDDDSSRCWVQGSLNYGEKGACKKDPNGVHTDSITVKCTSTIAGVCPGTNKIPSTSTSTLIARPLFNHVPAATGARPVPTFDVRQKIVGARWNISM